MSLGVRLASALALFFPDPPDEETEGDARDSSVPSVTVAPAPESDENEWEDEEGGALDADVDRPELPLFDARNAESVENC